MASFWSRFSQLTLRSPTPGRCRFLLPKSRLSPLQVESWLGHRGSQGRAGSRGRAEVGVPTAWPPVLGAWHWISWISREEGASRQPVNYTLWGGPRESLSHAGSQGGKRKVGHLAQGPSGRVRRRKEGGAQGRSKRRALREPGICQKQTGCLQAACYLSARGVWPLIRRRKPTPPPPTELPSPGLDSRRMGEVVSAPRPCFMAGHGFQKGQGMVAGRKASTAPTTEHLPCPFLLK